MSENTKLWDILGRTDPAHVKGFTRGGGFKGTAIKPMWSFRRMTEEFGPCGIGWGVNHPEFKLVDGPEGEILVFCTTSIWYRPDGDVEKTASVFGVGGDKVVGKNKYGLASDDEAFKKSYTDAITNALKMIGVGADVHMGLFDDSKYVQSMKEEFAEEPPTKSSAALKREDAWAEFERDLADVHTLVALESCKAVWRVKVKQDGWTAAWIAAMPDAFAKKEAEINAALAEDTEALIHEQFPGARTITRTQHPLEAG